MEPIGFCTNRHSIYRTVSDAMGDERRVRSSGGTWSTSSPAPSTPRFAAADFLPIVKEKSEAGRQPRRGARVREGDVVPHPLAYCAYGRAARRQAQAAFGGRFARLDSGHPTEAWLRIGFRDEWGLTVFPKSGTGRRRVQQMWMSSDPPLSSLTEVRIEHRLSL